MNDIVLCKIWTNYEVVLYVLSNNAQLGFVDGLRQEQCYIIIADHRILKSLKVWMKFVKWQ